MSVQETSNKLLAAAKLRKLEDIKGVLENLTDVFQHLQYGDDRGEIGVAGSKLPIFTFFLFFFWGF